MAFFGIVKKKQFKLKTESGAVSGSTYYSNFLPLNFYDPIYEGLITSNTSTKLTLNNIISVGSLLTTSRPYIIQTDLGYFFANTAQTITDSDSTITIDTTTYSFLGSPVLSTNSLADSRVLVRQLLRFADIHTSPISGLSVSGILGGSAASADLFFIGVDSYYYKTGIGPGWKTAAGVDATNVPAAFVSSITKRNSTAISFQVTKELYEI